MNEQGNQVRVADGRPVITAGDRLGLTLCLAIITHAVIVLGITFTAEDSRTPHYDTMEIILVQQQSPASPDDARLLAQANLEGGGDSDEALVPATPTPPPFPDNQPEVTMPPPVAAARPESTSGSEPEVIVSDTDTEARVRENPQTKAGQQDDNLEARKQKEVPLPSAASLLSNSFKIAALSSEIKRKLEAKSERPRRKFISASTREYRYAAYMEAWRAKVERVGNLNYPDDARRQSLSGSLILDVSLKADGTINDIVIRRSSGHKVLDDAAIRIVRLASPYSPFPDDIRSEYDILHITRTWQFLNNRGFR